MNRPNIRKPVVAGKFYPSNASGLRQQIESFLPAHPQKKDAIACMMPHAGYIFSGRVAVETASRIKIKDKIVLLGPSHTGLGAPLSIITKGSWQTPLGEVEIDSLLARKILDNSRYLKEDPLAHNSEHSLEVEIPILQYLKKDFKIIPMVFLSDDLEILEGIGEELAAALSEPSVKNSCLIVASSDMTHYESEKEARKKDEAAIEAILELDEEKLAQRVRQMEISMCGFAPAVVMLRAAKLLGAKSTELIKYETSAEATGDRSSVVGYAGVALY